MKPIIQKLWMFIAVLCTSLSASTYAFYSDGLYYNILSEEDRTVEVTDPYKADYVSGDIEIPRKVIYNSKTYTVTSIGKGAFRYCSSLESVTIPNSVTSIGDDAFSYCSSLESVTIPNSVTSIGDCAFYYCSSLASVTIPNSVTSIGDHAFSRCSSLESVTIPNSVTSIGCSPFSGCSKLKNIDVYPENANYSSIDGILYNKDVTKLICCPGAKISVAIPNSVTSIGDDAFSGCISLESVTIPNSVTSIGDDAFSGCSSLESVTIPNSVTSIGDDAFYDCNDLKTIYMQCEFPIECNPGFSDKILKETALYVPTGTKTVYKIVDPWRNFWNIEEMDFSGVDGIEADEYGAPHISVNNGILTIGRIRSDENVSVYDMQGRIFYSGTSHTIDNLSPGLYIVKTGSRTIKISI